jgi:MSHA biogenesis protein MshJ
MAVALRTRVQQAVERIDALELRERVLLLGAVVVVVFLVVDSFGLQPTLKAQQVKQQQISDLEMKLSALRTETSLLSFKSGDDPLQVRQNRRDTLAAELSGLDEQIVGQLGALVEPAQATELLKQVLSRHKGLRLTSLEASSAPLEAPDIETVDGGDLGRYQLDLALEGGYLDVLHYLQALESMPWKFFWQNVDFRISQHPQAVTRLQLYTLGARDG